MADAGDGGGLGHGGPSWSPTRRDAVFLLLAGVFIAHALLGEILGGKLVRVGGWIMSVGVIPWPLVFVTTDLVNEYFGPKAVRRLTLFTIGLIVYAFVIIYACIAVPTADISPVHQDAFEQVLGQSMWIIVGSLVAFASSQLLDVVVFMLVRNRTAGRMLWLRAVGSTVVSQLIDTFVINTIAFGISGKLAAGDVLSLSVTNYTYKFLIAIATLPLVYLGHGVVDRFLAKDHVRG
ncbi:MAG: queuosine precursor transporter [Nannocystaceae bacterium]|nr:queuosine precursor transporter [Nannocystaceae bacterium]